MTIPWGLAQLGCGVCFPAGCCSDVLLPEVLILSQFGAGVPRRWDALPMGLLDVSVRQGFGGSVELIRFLVRRNDKTRRNPVPQREAMWF